MGVRDMRRAGAEIAGTVAPADGVEDLVRVRWVGAAQSIDVDGERTAGAYDGSRAGGYLRVAPTSGGVAIRDLKVYRGGGG